MLEMDRLLEAYNIGQHDIDNIKKAAPAILARKDELIERHYSPLMRLDETARFFKDEKVLKRAQTAFAHWLERLLEAEYNLVYFQEINRIGMTHVRIGLAAHHVNVAINNVRIFLSEIVHEDSKFAPLEAAVIVASLNKAIDLNLDMMTRSYRQAELNVNFLSHRIDSGALRLAKWFVNGFNMALVVGLVIAGVMALGISVFDFINSFTTENVAQSVLRSLGSLLILWVVIELLDTQIRHIHGGSGFVIRVFISVALVAELRKVLIMSVEHSSWQDQVVPPATVLVLGFVYWLVSKIKVE